MQEHTWQGSSMNASQLLGYAITKENVDCLFTFQLLKKWERTEHTCGTLQAFHPFIFWREYYSELLQEFSS